MWIKTQYGELVNTDYVTHFSVKNRKDKLTINAEINSGVSVEVGEYDTVDAKSKAVEEFVQKIRRTGERFYQF